jgi:hypothetical protein
MVWIDVFFINLFRGHGLGFYGAVRVYRIAQLFRWLEEGNPLGWNIDLGTSLRIAARSGVALARSEAAEAANLNLVSDLQRPDDGVEERIDNDLPIAAGQVSKSGHFINKVGFRHGGFLSYWGEGDKGRGETIRCC